MFNFKMEGFDELKKKLDNLQKNISKLEGEHQVPFNELYDRDFIRRNSNFDGIEDMFQKSGFTINSEEDFKKIPDAEWDNFISKNTKFKSWKEMNKAAVANFTKKKLGL